MDTTLLIEIVIAVFVVWVFIKFIASPVIKLILGIIIFLFLLYLLQRLFGIGLDKILAPFGVSLNLDKLNPTINWIFGPLDSYINKIKSFIAYIWANVPKPQN